MSSDGSGGSGAAVGRPVADLLFRPRSVVVYGASSDPDKLSGRPLDYLLRFGFTGEIYAVNPRRDVVQGVRAYADVVDVPGPVDLAIIVVPAEAAVTAVERCAAAGVGAAIVFASGFGEIGAAGVELQERLAAPARAAGMRLIGPNCLGAFSAADSAYATFSTAFDEPAADGADARPESPVALVSQSGAVGTFTYSAMTSTGIGVRYYANPGNQSDVTVVELLRGLVVDADVDLLLGHLEDHTDRDGLRELLRAADERAKPVLLLKAGRTAAGARAVAAHTGSTAGDDADLDAAVAEFGAIRVESMEAMADAALGFVASGGRRIAGRRLTLVTQSGGAGALASDAAVELGLAVDTWTGPDREAIAAELPYFGSTKNPFDLTGALINDPGLLRRTLAVVCENDETDAVLVVLGNSDRGAEAIVAALVEAYRGTSKPFFVTWTGGSGRPRAALLAAGVPTYTEPQRAVAVLHRVIEHALRHETRS